MSHSLYSVLKKRSVSQTRSEPETYTADYAPEKDKFNHRRAGINRRERQGNRQFAVGDSGSLCYSGVDQRI